MDRSDRRPDGLLRELAEVVGSGHVLTDPGVTASYAVDWTGRWRGTPAAVVRPADTAQVAAVVRACAAHGVAMVPQGGNTGLVGGGVPADGEVVVSLRRLASLAPVDAAGRSVVAGAGVPLAAVQRAARAAGLDLGIDFAARDGATVGGVVATNAGGERVMRNGTTRAQVLGLQAVLADGSVVDRLGGLPKDNTGYDLSQLLVGSEGTLGIVTAAALRLVPPARRPVTALLALDSLGEAVEVLAALRTALPGLDAAEFFTADGLRLVLDATGQRPPFAREHPVHLLVEAADAGVDDVAAVLAGPGRTADAVRDAAIAQAPPDRRRLWELRERHTEAVNAAGVPVKLDVAVPLGSVEELVDRLPDVVAAVAPSARVVVFGHLAEGNVHVNLLGATPADADGAVTDAVLRLVAGLGGSISAEHGIGRAKRRWLGLTRSPGDVAAMRAVKRALDPHDLLSPGRVLP